MQRGGREEEVEELAQPMKLVEQTLLAIKCVNEVLEMIVNSAVSLGPLELSLNGNHNPVKGASCSVIVKGSAHHQEFMQSGVKKFGFTITVHFTRGETCWLLTEDQKETSVVIERFRGHVEPLISEYGAHWKNGPDEYTAPHVTVWEKGLPAGKAVQISGSTLHDRTEYAAA